ncbi:MAG: hypothetical protein OSB69_16260, partial [Alphaproteobacteria bacterium]|nr:hypothetical protein [Alphaproteobacteria bacterium]
LGTLALPSASSLQQRGGSGGGGGEQEEEVEAVREKRGSPLQTGLPELQAQLEAWCGALGRVDGLEGLKENVIVGRLIPAGTGSVMNRFKRIASERDRELAPPREEQALALVDDSEERVPAAE